MRNKNDYQMDVTITGQLNEAVLRGYIRTIQINNDWVSYRHPDYSLNSASLQEGRFNLSGQTAFYAASGDYCGQVEVPSYYERIPCGVKNHTVDAFDLPAFAADFNHEGAFVQHRDDGGWDVCQEVSNYLTTNHSVSGILYQSAACHKEGQHGICMAVLPSQEQNLPEDFFAPRTTKAEQGVRPNSAPASSSSRHDRYNLNPQTMPLLLSGVGGLDVLQGTSYYEYT